MVTFALDNPVVCLGAVSFTDQNLKNFSYKIRLSFSPRNSPATE
jgi:hypothetical protein